jgi:hypothetical protein
MAGTSIVEGDIFVGSYVNHCPRGDGQATTFQKIRPLVPRHDLNVTGNIDGAAPGIVAKGSFDNFVHCDHLAPDVNQDRRGGRPGGRGHQGGRSGQNGQIYRSCIAALTRVTLRLAPQQPTYG